MRFSGIKILRCLVIIQALACGVRGDAKSAESGTVRFTTPSEHKCPPRFRLTEHTFDYQLQWRDLDSPRFESGDLTFPSPVKTPHERNNTVHCEYYRPVGEGKRPAVIVLHILGGDFALARLFCHSLNQGGTAALFLKMPYYGPRREPDITRRMISEDPRETLEGMTQAVLDIRRAAAFLASREEIDPEQIGIMGVSLGGITAALAAQAEPRIRNACFLLAGGDFPTIAAESREFDRQRAKFIASGKDPAGFLSQLEEVDPLTNAQLLQGRRVLMLNAKSDEVIPCQCTEKLWKAAGEPEIIWLSGGHYSVMRHLPWALMKVNSFFKPK